MGSAPKAPTQTSVTQTTTNLPEYARPYFENLLQRGQALSYEPYQGAPMERIAGFTPEQQQLQRNVLGMEAPRQTAMGSALATQAGLGALEMSRTAGFIPVTAQQYDAPQMRAARTDYNPNLQYYQMAGPQSFTAPGTAEQYMSPYTQGVLDIQRREAIRGARQGQLAQDLGAARQGTYGGSRQLLAALGRERQLGQQLGDIEAQGLQAAYQTGQQQFNVEQQARQAAQQANLQAALGVQQLGTQTGLQTALANLDKEAQANVQNQAAILQTQGLNADQALRAALANQQAGLQAQQFGLAALQQAGQSGQTLGNLGQLQQQQDLSRLQAQMTTATMPQQLQQQYLEQAYADFLRQRDYPMEQLGFFSNILRGLPVTPSSTQTAYGQAPSPLSQIAGAGLGAASVAKLLG